MQRVGFGGVFFFQAEDGIRDGRVTGVQTCALPISRCWCCTTAWIAPSTTSRPAWGYLPRPSRPGWPGGEPSWWCSSTPPSQPVRRARAMSGPDLEDRLDHLLRSVAADVAPSGVEAVARRGRRRRMARRAVGGGLIAVLLAGVVLAKVVLPHLTSLPAAAPVVTGPAVGGIPDGVVPWSGGREGDGPRELSVTVLAGSGVGGQPS